MTQKEIYEKQKPIMVEDNEWYSVNYDNTKIYGFFDLNDDTSTKENNIWKFTSYTKEMTIKEEMNLDGNKITKIVIEKRKV